MIQRIQSVFLLIAAILLITAIFQPIWRNTGTYNVTNEQGSMRLDPFKTEFIPLAGDGDALPNEQPGSSPVDQNKRIVKTADTYHIFALQVVAAATAMFSILQFRKRHLQIRLGALNYIMLSALLCSYYFAIKTANGLLIDPAKGQFLIGFYIPIIAIILNFMAVRYIKKDEALVRSVDRIR